LGVFHDVTQLNQTFESSLKSNRSIVIGQVVGIQNTPWSNGPMLGYASAQFMNVMLLNHLEGPMNSTAQDFLLGFLQEFLGNQSYIDGAIADCYIFAT
jgi:hypothetical protein